MHAFRKHAAPGEELIFAPELLAGTYYYARLFPAARSGTAEPFRFTEESDRYQQALLYRDLARHCWQAAS